MATHYHLLLETPLANLAIGMKLINSGYAQGFNRRHKRVGALFQGRYYSVLIDDERHFRPSGAVHRAQPRPRRPLRAAGGLAVERLVVKGSDPG